MKKLELTFPGKVLTARRPRFNTKTRHTYNPQRNTVNQLRQQIKSQLPSSWKIAQSEVNVSIVAVFKRPKSKKAKSTVTAYIGTPDSDNVAKMYLDSMNGIVYEDDRFVSILFVEKRYTKLNEPNQPRVDIIVVQPVNGE